MDFITEGYEGFELSTQMLVKEALARGVSVEVLDEKDNFIRLSRGNRVELVKQATKTSRDSYITFLAMENKEVTKILLDEKGIKVPGGKAFSSVEEALEEYEIFKKRDIVVKPKSTNFGKGVFILKRKEGCVDYNEYKDALTAGFSYDNTVLVEEFIEGKEYRFLVIGDEVVAVLHRVPANVTGDGKMTIEELVAVKNLNPLRGKGYVTPLEKLALGKPELDFLALQGKNPQTVPAKGEQVFLRKNSNISTGGDSIDYTDTVHEAYKTLAVQASRAVGAEICGADIIIEDINSEPREGNHGIIELNFNPAIHIHGFPHEGLNRHPEKKVLDLLGFKETA